MLSDFADVRWRNEAAKAPPKPATNTASEWVANKRPHKQTPAWHIVIQLSPTQDRRSAIARSTQKVKSPVRASAEDDWLAKAMKLILSKSLAETIWAQARGPLTRIWAKASSEPTMYVTDSGALMLEWILKDRRLGIFFEPDPRDSGWFFVSTPEAGGAMDGGELHTFSMAVFERLK